MKILLAVVGIVVVLVLLVGAMVGGSYVSSKNRDGHARMRPSSRSGRRWMWCCNGAPT